MNAEPVASTTPSAASPLSGRRVLVTGAAGFLGRHLCHHLTRGGALVHGLGRSSPRPDVDVIHWHRADCEIVDEVRRVFDDAAPEVVFHLAGHADGRRDLELVLPSLHGDLVTAVNVMTVATERACRRIVLASSLEEPSGQQSDPLASSPYAAAKWAGTMYARMLHHLYAAPLVVGRVFMTYGPGQRSSKLIPYVIRSLLAGEPPQLGPGARPVDWIFVEDTVAGLLALATAEGIEGQTLDIGSGALVTIREVVEQIAAAIGGDVRPAFGVLAERPFEQVAYAEVDTTHNRTGWRPQVSLPTGLARTILAYRADLPTVPE